ncbi:MAG: peptidase [Caballeronia sp.]|jgi:murein DD-endopeptidase MepM/ murein hydrolase activator NlpD|uniref:M23 family metallopeptidase n=1 Tax=Caballeronia sp. TaxID=1931223 RepID=UPI00262F9295|nr:M23 family metallopeptidase [Caballeronia sp.]MDB5834730.1 peptidase [Caballeronia sp.]
MAFVIWSRRNVSHQRVRFVEARTVRAMVIVAVIAMILAALALGIAIGAAMGNTHAAEEKAQTERRSYEIDELGKISATLTHIEPRVIELVSQVNELQDFEAQLKAARRAADHPDIHVVPPLPDNDDESPLDSSASGGPSLPPRLCDAQRAAVTGSAPQRLKRTQSALDCLDATIGALDDAVLAHYASYMAFPGRQPAPDARSGSPFGNRIDPFTGHLNFHPGVDLVAPTGTAIFASAGGRVIQAGPHGGYGIAVDIQHSSGVITRYGHTSKIFVKVGDLVMPGQKIAEIGSTGRSTGPHLHFEVIIDGTQLNPTPYLALFKLKSNAAN